MLISLDEKTLKKQVFSTYHGLYKYIENLERLRHIENSQRTPPKRQWIFAYYPNERMVALLDYLSKNQGGNVLKDSEDGGLLCGMDLVEIMQGNANESIFIPVTPELDVDDLCKNWCNAYCKDHKILLIEIFDRTDFKRIAQRKELKHVKPL